MIRRAFIITTLGIASLAMLSATVRVMDMPSFVDVTLLADIA